MSETFVGRTPFPLIVLRNASPRPPTLAAQAARAQSTTPEKE